MRRSTDSLIALQFLAVVVPIAFVLVAQLMADQERAAALDHSRPLRNLANEARANYRTFTNGAAAAVDTGTLSRQSAEALRTSAGLLRTLGSGGESAVLGSAPDALTKLSAQIADGATLEQLLPLRDRIASADRAIRSIDDTFERRDAAVVRDAVDSARRQKREVTVALFVSLILTILFVLATRRRLKRKLEAEARVEQQRRAELETISIRFGMATQAARAGVYELHENGRKVWWSQTMSDLYGQSARTFCPTLSDWLALIHPEDREAAETAMATAMRDRKQLRTQYRIVRPDGSIGHVESLAAVVTDPADAGPRLVGIDLDITERVSAAERENVLQQQLRDASRQAGMAEVATSVLHNVGNVLNSVNVSANLVTGTVKKSRAAALGRVVSLLREHEADLGTFVSRDERGKVLPVYLGELSKQLAADQQSALQELESLQSNVEHIKEIVAMQQRYAKLSGASETIDPTLLVEESLRINTTAFERHAITVIRAFEPIPRITVDKHKVLQILVNLVRNAKDACEALPDGSKEVTIRVARWERGVRICVADTGIGILPENMTRIFTHGFTTKKSGHGFGLHSGALAARELGGTLRAESPGQGLGATFILELPLKSAENAHD
jgi:PAS domain S-box-containing protein